MRQGSSKHIDSNRERVRETEKQDDGDSKSKIACNEVGEVQNKNEMNRIKQ